MASLTTSSTAEPGDELIHGHAHPDFHEVRDEFVRNFTERGDVGASICVTVDGEEVVNLWGGTASLESGKPWAADTVTVVMSVTKGATALCAHMLADRGDLDFNAPVAEYWPEFAANGKAAIPVRMLLNHQAGLPGLRHELPAGAFCDWDYMVDALANESPFWEPGTRIGYHAMTFGWLVGEVIRRVSGKTPGTFFQDEVAASFGLDFWMGLPASEMHRVAPFRKNPEDPLLKAIVAGTAHDSIFHSSFGNTGGHLDGDSWNSQAAYVAENCAVGGITNGRSLAHMYRPLALGGSYNDVQLVEPETIARMQAIQSAVAVEMTVGMAARFTLGFQQIGVDSGLPGTAFGHGGWGGSLGFANPAIRLSFGYVTNSMNTTPRNEALTEATYRALGYHKGKYGLWVR